MVMAFRPQGGGGFAAEQLRWLRQRQAEAQRGSLGQEQLPSTGSGGFTLAQPVGQALRAPLAGGSWQRPVDTGGWASMGDGDSMGAGRMNYQQAAPASPLPAPNIGPRTLVSDFTPPVPDLTLRSDNAVNKPPALPRQQFEQSVDTLGDRGGATYDPQRGWVGGASVAAGTTLGNTGAKTWVNYDGSRDTQRHENGESSWRRVNRWMTEGVYEHGLSAQDAHNAALARLKRDFELSKLDWRTSGYDLSNVQSAAPGQDWGRANAVGAPKVDPVTGKPVADTKAPATTAPGQTGPVDASGLTTPVRDRMLREAEEAFNYLMRSKGFDPLSGGFATEYMRKYYMPDIEALQQMAGYANSGEGNGVSEIAGLLDEFGSALMAKGGGGSPQFLRGVADRAVGNAGGALDTMNDQGAMAFLENANYLRNRGSAVAENAGAQRWRRWSGEYSQDVNRTLSGDMSAPQTFREFMRQRGYTVATPFR